MALAETGAKVGLMDADIYGPTVPILLGLQDEQPRQTSVRLPGGEVQARMAPPERYGVSCISVGFFVEPGQPVIMRGPMLGKFVTQFLRDVDWGDLDYLLVDLPPGTGDVSMTLAQSIPLTGALVVMTPQDVAASIAVKAVRMFQKLDVPILGIVENMSYFTAPDTGTSYHIFGHGGGQEAAEALRVPFLGEIPLDIPTRRRRRGRARPDRAAGVAAGRDLPRGRQAPGRPHLHPGARRPASLPHSRRIKRDRINLILSPPPLARAGPRRCPARNRVWGSPRPFWRKNPPAPRPR